MVLLRINETKREYKRVGMTLQERDLNHEGNSWEQRPSCFEIGGKVETITIV
jgi:hypothetical protein